MYTSRLITSIFARLPSLYLWVLLMHEVMCVPRSSLLNTSGPITVLPSWWLTMNHMELKHSITSRLGRNLKGPYDSLLELRVA